MNVQKLAGIGKLSSFSKLLKYNNFAYAAVVAVVLLTTILIATSYK